MIVESGKVKDEENKNLEKVYNYTIKKVTEDYENLGFNTAISQMMIFVNECYKEDVVPLSYIKDFVKLIYPLVPHIGEELWEHLGGKGTITYESWPTYNEEALKDDSFEMVVQVNGKVRGKMEVSTSTSIDEMKSLAKEIPNVKTFVEGKEIVKEIVIPQKLVNIVVK